MDDLQHGEEVDSPLSIGVVEILRALAVLGILFRLFITFQIAQVEQDDCSEFLFIYLSIFLFLVPGIDSGQFTYRQALYHLKHVTNSFGFLFCYEFRSLLNLPKFFIKSK
jgi:hypothetical protein